MRVIDSQRARLGNAVFRYFASSLFCIIYGAERSDRWTRGRTVVFSDEMFVEWSKAVLRACAAGAPAPPLPEEWLDKDLLFDGYYQHDRIYVTFRAELLEWMHTHPDDALSAEGANVGHRCLVRDLLEPPPGHTPAPPDSVVLHLRLEDFVQNDAVIHPEYVKNAVDSLMRDKAHHVLIVVKRPETDLERNYIAYFARFFFVTIQSSDLMQDFHTLKSATTMVASCSTLGWCATFLSNSLTELLMPDYPLGRRLHETFRRPIANTRFYAYRECGAREITRFLDQAAGRL
jgi:hypothetical protein